MKFKFDLYTPDNEELAIPNDAKEIYVRVTKANNVIPLENGYTNFLGPVVKSSQSTGQVTGSISTRNTEEVPFNYIGTTQGLYQLNNTSSLYTSTDLSRTEGYTSDLDNPWEFDIWKDRVIATNFHDPIQQITIGGSAFADLPGGPAKAKHIAVIEDFLVLANLSSTVAGTLPYRLSWSGLDDHETHTVAAATQADFQDLKSPGGSIKRIVRERGGLIFQEKALTRMTYIGSPAVFQFDQLESEIGGTLASESVLKFGSNVAYLNVTGFKVFNGSDVEHIGQGQIDDFFFADLHADYKRNVKGAVDPRHENLYWMYASTASAGGVPDKLVIYNYAISSRSRWTTVDISANHLGIFYDYGYTLEELDNISTSIDVLQFSLDSPAYNGSLETISIYDTSGQLAFFSGTAATATIDTVELQLTENQRTVLTKARPLVTGTSAVPTIAVGIRNNQNTTVSYAAAVSTNNGGDCPLRATARYHRLRLSITGGFTTALGIDVQEFKGQGKR